MATAAANCSQLAACLCSQLPCEEVQQEATQAYRRMLRQHARMPAAHQALLQALDVDPHVAVWMGHYRRPTAAVAELLGMVGMVRDNVAFTAQHEQRKLRSQEHDARLQQQFRGLALFTLYWAAHHPFTTTLCLDCCDNAVVLARDVLQPWLSQRAAPQQQQQFSRQQQQQQQYSRQQVAQEALSCLPAVLTRLLAALHLHLDSSGSVGGTSSSGGSGSSREIATLESTPDGMVFLCQLLGVLLGAAGAWVPQEFSTQQQQLERQLTAAAWAQHAAELTAQLEAFCRASAASDGVAALSKDVTQGAYLQLLSQPVAREFGVSAIACVCVSAAGYKDVEGPLLQAAVAAGPGSREQRKLLRLLCSLLKYDAAVEVPPHRDLNSVQVGELSMGVEATDRWPVDKTAVAATCAKVLLLAAADWAAAAVAAAVGAGSGTASAGAAVASLPWLWLFGRCCVNWSGQQAASLRWKPATASNSLKHSFCHFREERCILLQMQVALGCWLSAGSVAAELAAAGYDLSPVQRQFAAAAAALHAAWDEAAGEQDVAGFLSELGTLGRMLCSTAAVKLICNNPACLTVTGRSEKLLVSGRSCICGRCCIAHYCCDRCQHAHWAEHKRVCKALAAAAGGGRNAAAAAAAAAVLPTAAAGM